MHRNQCLSALCASLLIAGAATVDDAAADSSLVGIVPPLVEVAEADGVDMGVDGDQAWAGADAGQQVAETVDPETIVSAEVSLGYDISNVDVEKCLKDAASEAGLSDPFVLIMNCFDGFHAPWGSFG